MNEETRSLIRGLVSIIMHALALERRLNPHLVLGCATESGKDRRLWLEVMRMRRHAIYLTIVTFNISQTEAASALHCSRTKLYRLLRAVEKERNHARLDHKLDRLDRLYRGPPQR